MAAKRKIERGIADCTLCTRKLKWSEESRGSFGIIKRWFHARVGESFVTTGAMTVDVVSLQFHEMYGGKL